MKNYLDFQLTGKKILPLWIIFYLIFIAPYILLIFKLKSFSEAGVPNPHIFLIIILFILLILIALIWSLYYAKIIMQSVSLNETSINCNYKLGKYLGVVFLGLFLSIITIGIYSPWFIRNIQRFFIDNSSYKDKNFSFQGKGGKLLLIMLLSIVIPMVIISLIILKTFGIADMKSQTLSFRIIYQMIVYLILVPYMYYIYKWMVDIKYNEYHIKWETKFLPSIGKIALEVVLSMITCGIYFPLAYIRLYKYFAERTKSNVVDNQSIKFGYDIDQLSDFLLIWGQILLTIITLGIYYPWALCKITKRILGKTYIEKIIN